MTSFVKKILACVAMFSCILCTGCEVTVSLAESVGKLQDIVNTVNSGLASVAETTTEGISETNEPKEEIHEPDVCILNITEDTLAVEKYMLHVGVGDTSQIAIAECPTGFEDKLLFLSDNPAIATVNDSGVVTGVNEGTATITVALDGAAGYSSVMIYVY